nr:GNAT family N-acetyltransferase [Bacteroidota bacterium]
MAIKIRKLKYKEIELLRDFPPADWHFNIVSFMKLHFGEDYFIPFVAEHSGEIVGVGNGIYTGDTGWLGNIIVKNDHRGKGVGTAVTNHLIVALKKWNCKSLLLIATRQGEPIYRKLGFNTTQYYHFFRCGL